MSDKKIMEAYLQMVSEASCGKDRMKKEEREECPKCEGEGCDHCDGKGYHEKELDESKKVLTRYQELRGQGKKDAAIIDIMRSDTDFKGFSRDKLAKIIGDALRSGKISRKVKEDVELEEKKLDPVNDKENDKKFKDRKDKDIDNDGDVDDSDEYLHNRRAKVDNEIDGGEKPADNAGDEKDDKKKKDKNPRTSDKTAEISKIGEKVTTKEDFDALWCAMEEAVNQKKGATPPEGMDDKESKSGKDFKAMHKVDAKDHDELERVEEPKERKVKKEMKEFEVIRALLSGKPLED